MKSYEVWYEDAQNFCRYFLSLGYVRPRKKYIMAHECGFTGMVQSCVSHMWERGNKKSGIADYYSYLTHTYMLAESDALIFSEIGADDNDEFEFDVNSEAPGIWHTLGHNAQAYEDISQGREGEPFSGDTLFGVPSGATSRGGLSPIQDEDRSMRAEWQEYVENLTEQERDILYTWANVRGNADIAELCGTTVDEVRRVYKNAKTKATRMARRYNAA